MTDSSNERPRFVVQVDRGKYDIADCMPDTRAVNREELTKAFQGSVVEHRLRNITKFKMFPYADAQDISEWDRDTLLNTFRPHYMNGDDSCTDCQQGPCDLRGATGRCGLSHDAYQSRLSLQAVCRGCLSQMATSRRILDYALARFGKDARVTMGKEQDTTDATWLGIMCGFYPETLDQLDRGLKYAESQLGKALLASVQGAGTVDDFEQMAFHAGTMLFLAQEVSEYVGISFFGFTSAMNQGLADVAWYPPGFQSGIGKLSQEKPTLGFVGDDFIPAWLAIEEMKKFSLTENVQVIGMGAAGDAIARYYNKVCVLGTMYRVKKALRLGLVDVLVGSECCIAIDFLGEVRKSGARLIWTGVSPVGELKDRSNEQIADIAKDLCDGSVDGVWIRDPEKAAAVAVQVVQQIKRVRWQALDEAAVRREAGKCRADCDLCTFECPNDLLMGQALRAVAGKGIEAVFEVEKSCIMCGRCEAVCPEKIHIEDIVVAAYGARNKDDKFLYRPGRGPVTRSEVASYGFTFFPGNSPGIYSFIGCSNCNPEDIAWMANRVAEANGIVSIAGCAASDVAHLVDEQGVPMYRKFPFWTHPRSVANLGGCASCQYVPWIIGKYARAGTGVTWCANFAETVDESYAIFANPTIIWGGLPERMYAIAAGLARTGISVIIGPVQSQEWKRLLGGNKWDWERYWWYDSLTNKKRACSPAPKDLIFPVETKEEAITYIISNAMKANQPFIMRMAANEFYYSWHKEFFGELPDDWALYARTFTDLPTTMRYELTEALKERYDWEVYGLWVESIPHFDGKRYSQKDYLEHYAQPAASYTRIPRLCMRQPKQKQKQAGQ